MNIWILWIDLMKQVYQVSINFIVSYKRKILVKMITNMLKKVWDVFEINILGEYHDVYVQVDTARLSNAFENFKSLCLEEYQLDPAYFVSTPSLVFEAMFKITKVKIELFTDINMVLMTEKGIRHGLTQVFKKML